jgi:hypothetical protein
MAPPAVLMYRFLIVVCFLLVGCFPLREDYMEAALVRTLADPALLAEVCNVAVDEIGAVSPSGIAITQVSNERSWDGSGTGSAQVSYRPTSSELAGKSCVATVNFTFDDMGGTKVTPETIRLKNLRFTDRSRSGQ